MKNKYYDGTKLLSLMDINGDKPEIYMCTSNRSAGKTTYFGRMFINHWFKNKSKFLLLYRYKYEVKEVADAFFKDIGALFFPGYRMCEKPRCKDVFRELFVGPNDAEDDELESCGYALALSSANSVKRYSHLLSDVDRILMDEFQSETNKYIADEVSQLMSIHTSIARGQGKQVRYLPIYMLSNCVSLINPYYTALGISARLNSQTKFLRGEGWVLEQGYVDTAAQQQKQSAFNRAFANASNYLAYSTTNVYLNDNLAFIEKMTGKSTYLYTIKYKNTHYAVREFAREGIIYCDDNADLSFPRKLSLGSDAHDVNYVMLNNNMITILNLRYFFEHGAFRFKNLACKECIMTLLSY
ncbi:MAG: phage DNA encapsidation protein [Lachnospiraceae bacterium]|nr:phage DNA encapsidation protein [Lachnospiraceae bacterium]